MFGENISIRFSINAKRMQELKMGELISDALYIIIYNNKNSPCQLIIIIELDFIFKMFCILWLEQALF